MNKSNDLLRGISHPLRTTLIILFPVLVYGLILVLPVPKEVGATIRHGFNLWLVVAGVILYLGFRIKGTNKDWISFTPVAILFGLGLSGLWSNAFSEMQVVGGMLYFSDAFQYYTDALRILNGFPFSNFSARHPLPTLFTALVLWITGKNLQITIAILVFICALCVYLAGREIVKIYSSFAATLFILGLFLFYRRFSGQLDSENLGLALGCLSFSLFIRKSDQRFSSPLIAMMLLSLALAARPGAFLILPAVLLWFSFMHLSAPRPKLTRFLLGTLVLSSGFTITYITNAILGEQGSRMYSNLAYTLYGISQGGKGWEQFLRDFPEYAREPTVTAEKFAYKQAAQAFSQHPEVAFQGLLKSTLGYFSTKDQSLFGFLCGGEITAFNKQATQARQSLYQGVRLAALILSGFGIIKLWKDRKNPASSLTLVILLGWFFSLPIIPSEDAGIMRVYAVSMPFLILLPTSGLAMLVYKIGINLSSYIKKGRESFKELQLEGENPTLPIKPQNFSLNDLCTYVILGLLFSGTILIKAQSVNHPQSVYLPTCQPGKMSSIIQIYPGSFITLVEDVYDAKAYFPEIQYRDYLKSISEFHRKESFEPLASLPPGSSLMNTISLSDGLPFWAVLPQFTQPLVNHRLAVCGHWDAGFEKIGLGFLVVEQSEIVK